MDSKQVLEMAKLIFFNIDGGAAGEWEKLAPERQDEYIHKVRAIEENFSRIGLGVLPINFVAPDNKKLINQTQLELYIRDFITTKVKKPSGILNIFPYQQLAYEIALEFHR